MVYVGEVHMVLRGLDFVVAKGAEIFVSLYQMDLKMSCSLRMHGRPLAELAALKSEEGADREAAEAGAEESVGVNPRRLMVGCAQQLGEGLRPEEVNQREHPTARGRCNVHQ